MSEKVEDYLREHSFSDVSMGWENVQLSVALEGVRIAREEERAKRLPINWRSNKEVIALVQSAIKNTREDEINKLQQVDKELAKEIFSRMDSQNPNHNTNSWAKELKKVEVRVREETARNLIAEIRAGSYPKNINDKTVILAITDEMLNIILRRYLVKTEVQKE